MDENEIVANWVANELVKEGMFPAACISNFVAGFVVKMGALTSPGQGFTLAEQAAAGKGSVPAYKETINVAGKQHRQAYNAPAVQAQQAGQVTGVPMDMARRAQSILQGMQTKEPMQKRFTSAGGAGGVPGMESLAPKPAYAPKIKLSKSFKGASALLDMLG